MPTAGQGEGLYIALEIAPTREITRFVKDIPPRIGDPLDPRDLTMTLMYPEELGDRALSREERRRLPGLVRKIHRDFGHISVAGSVVSSVYGELIPHKKFVAIAVDPADTLIEARSEVARLVSEDMGIYLPNTHPKGWHISVARRTGSGERLPPYKRPLPENLTVSGTIVAIRNTKNGNFRYLQDYANRPRNLRRK